MRLVGDDDEVVEALEVVEQHPGVLIESARLATHRVLRTAVRIALSVLGGDELLDVEYERQHGHFPAERKPGRTVLAGDPRRVVLRRHDLGRHCRAGDVAGGAGGEVLHGLGLHRLARGDDHDIPDPLTAQVLHERGHEVGLADAGGEVEHLHDGRVVVAVEREDQLTQRLLVRGAQVELRAERLQHIGVEIDVEPARHYWSPPSL